VHVFALAAVLVVASCDRLPDDTVGPSGDTPVPAFYYSGPVYTANQITVIKETTTWGLPLSVQSLIGLLGGVLNLNGHSLLVPKGAVTVPTLFIMSTPNTSDVDVDLLALLPTLLGKLLNVGERGFAKPVTVTLSYGRAYNVTNASRLFIVRKLPDGRYEKMPSTVDPVRKTVSAQLDHFSKYCMASN
jgi:hypothetical protein